MKTKKRAVPKKRKVVMEKCPKCGMDFDPKLDHIIECPVCADMGSTACCNSGGVGVPCNDCEESNHL